MITRAQELCRKLKPVLGRKVDRLWAVYLSESEAGGRADIEQTLELLAAKHLGLSYEPDRSPFPPPSRSFSSRGDISLGQISYADRELYPFALKSDRLREHVLIAGRSGSGKTNLSFVLMRGMMDRGIKVLALDWKRAYRDLLTLRSDLRVYTIGRDVSPFRFNPLIPPPGCEINTWIKLIVDVIASSYLGGEGVISLLVGGLDHLFRAFRKSDGTLERWPNIRDLLVWLQKAKLRGRAAMWQASAQRILLSLSYGEFGRVLDTQDNSAVHELLDHNVVFEMDGLASSSDRSMFSEAMTLYLYRYRLAQGPRDHLTNVIVLEEAHNLLLAKPAGTKESVLETSIRMIRQYGLGYVFVDQSASLLSRVAFANSYATLALSQKLRADVQAMTGAMNLTDDQRDALKSLPVGSAVVRLADEHTEPFLVRIPRCPIEEGSVSDSQVRERMASCYADSGRISSSRTERAPVPAIPARDRKETQEPNQPIADTSRGNTPPPTPGIKNIPALTISQIQDENDPDKLRPDPPTNMLNREETRLLSDVAARPLSTTVSRYDRLHLSRRRGNAIRQSLVKAGIIESVAIATRSGQVVLFRLTDLGRSVAADAGIDARPRLRASLEHQFWARKIAAQFERNGYEVALEQPIKGNGTVDVVAERPGERVAIEVETGKSDIAENLTKAPDADFDRIILLATTPAAVDACEKALEALEEPYAPVEMMTWLDVE